MAIYTFFFIAGSCINDGSMGQHGPTFIRDMKNVAMAFLALFILKSGVGFVFLQSVIIQAHIFCEMDVNILDAVQGLGVKKINCIVGSGQMTVHAVCDKPLGIIDMRGCFPGIIGISDFMAGGAELRRRRSDHGVITETEKGKSDQHHEANK